MKVKVAKSKIADAGKGLFTNQAFKKGELIGLAHKNGQPVGDIGKMHNHSEDPTAFSVKFGNKRFIYANRDLKPGEEITTDYRMQPELEQPDQFKKGGSIPKMPKKKNAKAYSRSLEATNRLFTENSLFEQPKSRKNKIYDPKAKYYQDGGELPEDYQTFLDYSATAPENRQPSKTYYYGSPEEYDHYGMWEALGKPKNFEEALQMNPDWEPDPYDGYYHGFSVNPNTGVFLKSGKPGFKEGDTTWMEIAGHYLSPRANESTPVFDIDLQRFRYIPKQQEGGSKLGPISLNSGKYAAKKYPFGKFSGVFKKQDGGEPTTPEEWAESIKAIEREIGNPDNWTYDDLSKLQGKLYEYKAWREQHPEVIDTHNKPFEYEVPLPKQLNPAAVLQKGGESGYIELELSPEEIEEYKKGGYIIEDISIPTLSRYADGGDKRKKKNQETEPEPTTTYEYYKRADDPSRAYVKDSSGQFYNYSNGFLMPIEEGYDIEKDLIPNLQPMSEEEKQLVQTAKTELPAVEVTGKEMPLIQRVGRKLYRAFDPEERKRVKRLFNDFSTEEDITNYLDQKKINKQNQQKAQEYFNQNIINQWRLNKLKKENPAEYNKIISDAWMRDFYEKSSLSMGPQSIQAVYPEAYVMGPGAGLAGMGLRGLSKAMAYSPVAAAPWLNLGTALEADMAYQAFKDEGYVDQAADAFNKGNYKEGIAKAAMAGLGAVGPLKLISELGQTSKVSDIIEGTGEFLTTQTPLRNAYKINPWAFKPNPEAYYRVLGKEGVNDALESGVIRANQKNIDPFSGEPIYDRPYFSKGVPFDRDWKSPFINKKGKRSIGSSYPDENMVEVFGDSRFHRTNDLVTSPINTLNSFDDGINFYKRDWLRGYKPVNTSVQNIEAENIIRAGSGGMDMSRYEIKNPDYYTQLLNTYDSRKLSQQNRKFYTDLINSVKKQNGLVTERQYNELQRLKTGNFNYGKKGYAKGGTIELELTPKEIEEYKSKGYIVEEY